jgi:hypothetical protein
MLCRIELQHKLEVVESDFLRQLHEFDLHKKKYKRLEKSNEFLRQSLAN